MGVYQRHFQNPVLMCQPDIYYLSLSKIIAQSTDHYMISDPLSSI